MGDTGYRNLVWTTRRVFVSPALGCPASCAFCYLPSSGEAAPTHPSQHDLAEAIQNDTRFSEGINGTLISLGCLSECLAPHAIGPTFSFLEGCKKWHNPIQLATRWIVPQRLQSQFFDLARGCNLVLFHSMSTVTHASSFERGTAKIARRLEFLDVCADAGLRNVLYIKPFISGITGIDADEFVSIAKSYRLNAIVIGPLYLDTNILRALENVAPKGWNAGAFAMSTHPVGADPMAPMHDLPNGELRSFVERLQGTGLPVHQHSIEFFFRSQDG